ncbi:uncharacterized protein LOC118179439 [Stegodyphus dumicola]|uniref:uncharacterized protein LOC118179439 n=1 Tax=Stegodyphus dumicola TaxID=202533 RepID=UPI0015B179A4|nr:uncharacterized protein LOC118179439 [Stegodyphus dumicola]
MPWAMMMMQMMKGAKKKAAPAMMCCPQMMMPQMKAPKMKAPQMMCCPQMMMQMNGGWPAKAAMSGCMMNGGWPAPAMMMKAWPSPPAMMMGCPPGGWPDEEEEEYEYEDEEAGWDTKHMPSYRLPDATRHKRGDDYDDLHHSDSRFKNYRIKKSNKPSDLKVHGNHHLHHSHIRSIEYEFELW